MHSGGNFVRSGRRTHLIDAGMRLSILAAMLVLVFVSCAKQGYPPGGPKDEAPPEVLGMIPELNAVNVSRTDPVVIRFSEPVMPETVVDNLIIVPIPAEWPSFNWREGNRNLEIRFAEPLLEATTYVITIGSKASDRNRNRLEDSITLTFSTGDRLENRVIEGAVTPFGFGPDEQEDVSSVDVIAYRLADGLSDPDPRNDVPDYFTQTGADGTYELHGLSGGTYRLFAVGDRDGDGFYSAGYDQVGIAPHDVTVAASDSVATAPVIALAMRDTSMVQLFSITVPDSRRVQLFLDRDVESDPVGAVVEGLDIETVYRSPENHAMLTLVTTPQENGREYELSEFTAVDGAGNIPALFGDMLPPLTGTDHPDTTMLAVTSILPPVLRPDDTTLRLEFNRMLDVSGTDAPFSVEPDVAFDLTWPEPYSMELSARDGWPMGEMLRLTFDTDLIAGVAGNVLREEDRTIAVRIAPEDTLGTITGSIRFAPGAPHGDGPFMVQCYHVETETVTTYGADSDGFWMSGPVLPGRYLLRAFRDDDGDGGPGPGNAWPYEPAEPVSVSADTVLVESRWENEENDLILY
jgi:hypothetical protein